MNAFSLSGKFPNDRNRRADHGLVCDQNQIVVFVDHRRLNTFNDMPAVWSFANPRYVSGVGYVKRGCIDVLVRIPTDGDSTINCERCSGDET